MESICQDLIQENQTDLPESMTEDDRQIRASMLNILDLPDSIVFRILTYLPFSSVGAVAQVCTQLNRISSDELLWRHIFLQHYKLPANTLMPPRAKSWRNEFKRLYYHTPAVLSEERKEHKDEVLHVSFSHDGTMFATCSKDGFFKVWECTHPVRLLFKMDMKLTFSWKFTQFSQFNETDTCLLVSGVYFGHLSTSGEIAVFNLQDDFRMQCRVTNKPYDVFGAWYDSDHLLSGTLYWTGDFNSVSAVWLSKASQEVESEVESVSMVLYRFENVNSSSIRLLHVAEVDKDSDMTESIADRDESEVSESARTSPRSNSLGIGSLDFDAASSGSEVKDKCQGQEEPLATESCILDQLLQRYIAEDEFDLENEDKTDDDNEADDFHPECKPSNVMEDSRALDFGKPHDEISEKATGFDKKMMLGGTSGAAQIDGEGHGGSFQSSNLLGKVDSPQVNNFQEAGGTEEAWASSRPEISEVDMKSDEVQVRTEGFGLGVGTHQSQSTSGSVLPTRHEERFNASAEACAFSNQFGHKLTAVDATSSTNLSFVKNITSVDTEDHKSSSIVSTIVDNLYLGLTNSTDMETENARSFHSADIDIESSRSVHSTDVKTESSRFIDNKDIKTENAGSVHSTDIKNKNPAQEFESVNSYTESSSPNTPKFPLLDFLSDRADFGTSKNRNCDEEYKTIPDVSASFSEVDAEFPSESAMEVVTEHEGLSASEVPAIVTRDVINSINAANGALSMNEINPEGYSEGASTSAVIQMCTDHNQDIHPAQDIFLTKASIPSDSAQNGASVSSSKPNARDISQQFGCSSGSRNISPFDVPSVFDPNLAMLIPGTSHIYGSRSNGSSTVYDDINTNNSISISTSIDAENNPCSECDPANTYTVSKEPMTSNSHKSSIGTQTEITPSRASSFHSLSHMSQSSSLSRDFRFSPPREKLLIYTWGSETYIPHKVGIKRMKWTDFTRGEVTTRRSSMLLPDVMENLHNMAGNRRDKPDVTIEMHGHIVGLSLSPDHKYLYVNCRPWPPNYVISDPQESPPLAQEVEISTIDLTTFNFVGPVLRSHKAYTHSDECFFLNLDVSDDYVASGAEDRQGYLWDRHYGIPLYRFPHRNVVNCVAINPVDPEILVTVSDDYTFKVWMSRCRAAELTGSKEESGEIKE